MDDLGFLLTNDLNFDQHCEQIATKAMGATYRLFKALTTRDISVLLCAYRSYIRPLLEYGTVIFNPYKQIFLLQLIGIRNWGYTLSASEEENLI
ncbi:hypothetical protein Y032_0017g3278 [Ancylostoma ceylanicum]|uniref:Reverse transcriptase domain-containing protein n=1 Tax=Ancylostoma ceylanicum TaxID=53326 RepID=A0A016V6E7_9BILA|nr:hypothetical protein Y032_0017g3278 [Ancylostoma ceylanicum]